MKLLTPILIIFHISLNAQTELKVNYTKYTSTVFTAPDNWSPWETVNIDVTFNYQNTSDIFINFNDGSTALLKRAYSNTYGDPIFTQKGVYQSCRAFDTNNNEIIVNYNQDEKQNLRMFYPGRGFVILLQPR